MLSNLSLQISERVFNLFIAISAYAAYADQLYQMVFQGFSAAVYTQTTDCETELNGLMTYDRAVVKMDPERLLKINRKISHALAE